MPRDDVVGPRQRALAMGYEVGLVAGQDRPVRTGQVECRAGAGVVEPAVPHAGADPTGRREIVHRFGRAVRYERSESCLCSRRTAGDFLSSKPATANPSMPVATRGMASKPTTVSSAVTTARAMGTVHSCGSEPSLLTDLANAPKPPRPATLVSPEKRNTAPSNARQLTAK